MNIRIRLIAIATLAVAATSAMAVKPGQWVQDTEADFGSASLDQAVVTNLGRIELSRASEKIASLGDDATIIYDMVSDPAGNTYLAVGPTGELAALDKENKIESLAKYEDQQVFALAVEGDALWVAISGKTCKLEKREAGKVTLTIEVPDTRYIWDMLIADDKIYLATGTDGKVLELDPADPRAKPVVVLDCQQNNVLCLGIDRQKRLYAGTDSEGLVYRITPQANNAEHPFGAFVMYDAVEPEIGAMVVMADGTVYAGTADADQAKPGRLNEATKDEQGKPSPAPAPGSSEVPGAPGGGDDKPGEKPAPQPIPAPPEKPQPPLPPAPQPQPGEGAADQKEPADAEHARKGLLSLPMTEAAIRFADGEVPSDNSGKPTKAQYQKLRELIGRRLIEARKAGSLAAGKGGSGGGAGGASARIGPRRAGANAGASSGSKPGNAVYRITPDGFVSEVFRESVMILRMAMIDGKLIITTGNEGQIYRIDPTGQEVTVLADLESQQAPAMMVRDKQIFIGTANPAQVVRLNAGFAPTGTFTADPLDAAQISHWGQLQVVAEVPDDTAVTVSTRSGNIADPDNGFWSDWSRPTQVTVDGEGQPFFMEVASPSARFVQYKLTLTSKGGKTPSVSLVSLKYLMPNLAPRIAALRAKYPDLQIKPDAPAAARNVLNVDWEAADPNGDAMNYTLEARQLGTDQPFVKIAGDLKDASYAWNTLTMPDGRYELRVTADDSPDNVPDQVKTAQRLSAPIVIDNTAPTISDLAVKSEPGRVGPAATVMRITAKISDKMSVIADIRYSLSSDVKSDASGGAQPVWNAVLPVDQIDDSTNESVSFTIPPLAPGVRVLTIRATDAQGNTAYQSATVTVPRP